MVIHATARNGNGDEESLFSFQNKSYIVFPLSMEYHRTKDILHVMKILGHKNIQNTLKYTQLVNFEDDEYICKVAKTLEDACALMEAGFEDVCEIRDAKLFRKRK